MRNPAFCICKNKGADQLRGKLRLGCLIIQKSGLVMSHDNAQTTSNWHFIGDFAVKHLKRDISAISK